MLIAANLGGDGGRKVLFVGLHEENVRELVNDRPIRKSFREGPDHVPGLEEWDLVILGPEDAARLVALVTAGEIAVVPPG